ncbi:hypothetical protein AGABI2DRAFT_113611 [Agaricus bisporus var. bisporus H97]|uniref:hypothetical protein n=1 Tax=Agaricus bisporus var. bisporus (strain H97 / ATCC MYA-4626 / FGSC 10389) TaxID=936046 RepID=UPI00029F5AB1|nr:hypothetical protein AGABI2DRAFT_113611 [Agaricus bisporus var. bisporus H97]EKV50859.1 hypothetical protein AGABI2DRAFT_113611 [Agaricus bisporus var. bisporus H97]
MHEISHTEYDFSTTQGLVDFLFKFIAADRGDIKECTRDLLIESPQYREQLRRHLEEYLDIVRDSKEDPVKNVHLSYIKVKQIISEMELRILELPTVDAERAFRESPGGRDRYQESRGGGLYEESRVVQVQNCFAFLLTVPQLHSNDHQTVPPISLFLSHTASCPANKIMVSAGWDAEIQKGRRNLRREVYTEYGAIYDLIHTRRICWYSQYDFSKPNELVDFFCKVAQMDLDPSISQEQIAIAKFVLQLDEFRDYIGTHDGHRNQLQNAQVAGEMLMNVTYDWLGKAYKAHGLWDIEEGDRKPDAKNMYHEVG